MSRGVLGATALLILITSLPTELAAQDSKVTKTMEAAEAAFAKGRYEDALEKYQAANQASGGSEVPAILGALEASLALGRYDGIITQVSGASSDDPAQQAQIDALVGRAHLLTAYVVDPTLPQEQREALAVEHRKRAATRLQAASDGSGDWSTRSRYYLAEAHAALGDMDAAKTAVDAYLGGGGRSMTEAMSATSLQGCLNSGQWASTASPAKQPEKIKGPAPRRAADGRSFVELVIDAEGVPQCIRMIPPLSERANEIVFETLAAWRYHAAENASGEAIAIPFRVDLDFAKKK